MIRHWCVVTVSVVLATAAAAATAHAQPSHADRAVALDLGLARVAARSPGRFRPVDTYGVSGVVMLRVRPAGRGALIAGVNGDISGSTSSTECIPYVPCTPSVPFVSVLGMLAGWEARDGPRGATLRASLGPALIMPQGEPKTGGVQTRVDLSTPSVAHVSLIGYVYHATALAWDRLRMTAVGLGLRIR